MFFLMLLLLTFLFHSHCHLLIVVPTCILYTCSVVVLYSQIFIGALLLTYLLFYCALLSTFLLLVHQWCLLIPVDDDFSRCSPYLSLSLSVTYPSCVCSVCSVTCLPAKRRVYILSKSTSTHVSVTQENTWSVCDLCYLSSSKWNWMHLCQP